MVAVEVWDSPRRSSSMNRNTYLGIASSRFMGFEVTTNGTARSRRPDEESWLAPRGLPATRRHLARAFQCEQAALGGEATGVAAQAAVGCDHPVARDDDRDRIGPERPARRARGALVPGALRHGRVRRQLPIGDARRRTEDASLERRESGEVHRDGERTALPGEVLLELARETAGAARIGHEARAVRPHQPREIGRRRLVSVVQRGDAGGGGRDPERAEGRVENVVAKRGEPLAPRAPHQALPSVGDGLIDHRVASFTFFMASATRERAASSLQPSAAATSRYGRPSTLWSTNAARCPGGSVRIEAARSASVTPSRSGAARRSSASGTRRRFRRARSIALFVAILYSHARSAPRRGGGHARKAARKVSW